MIPETGPPDSSALHRKPGPSHSRARSLAVAAAFVIGLILIVAGLLLPDSRKRKNAQDVFRRLAVGEVRGNTYSSKAFGFRLTFPDGWYVASQREKDRMRVFGERVLHGDKPGAVARAMRTKRYSPYLLYVNKYPMNVRSERNASLLLIAGRIDGASRSVRDGGDALRHFLEQPDIFNAPGELKIVKQPYKHPFGGKPFFRADLQWELKGIIVRISFFALIVDKRILVAQISWIDEKDREPLENTMKSITFI